MKNIYRHLLLALVCFIFAVSCNKLVQKDNVQLYSEADKYIDDKNYEKAEEILNDLIEKDSSNSNYFHLRSYLYLEINDTSKALKDMNKALEIDDKLVKVYKNRALLYAKQKKYEQSIDDCKKVILLEPSFTRIYVDMGLSYFYMKKYQEAIITYNEGLKFDSTNYVFYMEIGNCNTFMGNFPEALKYMLIANEYNNKDPYLCYNIALTYNKLNDTINARKFDSLAIVNGLAKNKSLFDENGKLREE